MAFVWALTKETIHLPLDCLQGGGREVVDILDVDGALDSVEHLVRSRQGE